MKIYVSQGHERGIGLEVFLKSCLLLGGQRVKNIKLVAHKESLLNTIRSLKIPFELSASDLILGNVCIPLIIQKHNKFSQSFSSLNVAMEMAEREGILFTLPTSKDQFPSHPGHTEYFRKTFNLPNLGMYFHSPDLQILLLSDHIPLKKVSVQITEKIIYERIHHSLISLKKWNFPVYRVLISGFNPHGGEDGLIGHEDIRVKNSIIKLRQIFKYEFKGPYSGDGLIFERESSKDLLVYIFHDQGLGVFKSLQGFIGANITLGLPFLRLSPDHGTSFKIFGKNIADFRGCEYALKLAINLSETASG